MTLSGGRRWGRGRRTLTVEAVLVILIFAIAVAIRLPTLHQPLLEAYPFRQTQTAYTALIYHTSGIDLLSPQLPVLGKPWQVPFEFPLFQAAAASLMDVGLRPDLALRLTGLGCFMAAAFALWGLVRRISTPVAAGVALLVFLATPFDIYWSRTSMIDYMAVALAVGYAWAGIAWLDERRLRYAVIAVVLGSLAMLVKLPTAVFWAAPLLLYGLSTQARALFAQLRARLIAAVPLFLVPLGITALWTVHADRVKAASPSTAWLTTSALTTWNLGTVTQRLDLANWQVIAHRLDSHLTGMPLWLLGVLFAIAILRERRLVWLGVVLAAVMPVVTFFNLFVVHDYYLMAVTPAVAAIIGYVFDGAWTFARRTSLRVFAVAVAAGWLVASLVASLGYLTPLYATISDPAVVLPAAAEVSAGTRPQALIIFEGLDWSPAVPYYSRRTGMMLPAPIVTPSLLSSLPSQGYRYLFAASFDGQHVSPTAAAVLDRWAWFGVVSTHLFDLGTSVADLSPSPVLAAPAGAATPVGAASLLHQPMTLSCDGARTSLPVASGAQEWLQLGNPTAGPVPILTVDGSSLPAEPTVVVRPAARQYARTLSISCTAAASVTILSAASVPG